MSDKNSNAGCFAFIVFLSIAAILYINFGDFVDSTKGRAVDDDKVLISVIFIIGLIAFIIFRAFKK